MTAGPHIFDNLYADLVEEASWDVVEIEQGDDPERRTVVGVVMIPKSRKALVITTGFEDEDAWAQVSKIDTATGASETTRVVIDGADIGLTACDRTDVC